MTKSLIFLSVCCVVLKKYLIWQKKYIKIFSIRTKIDLNIFSDYYNSEKKNKDLYHPIKYTEIKPIKKSFR